MIEAHWPETLKLRLDDILLLEEKRHREFIDQIESLKEDLSGSRSIERKQRKGNGQPPYNQLELAINHDEGCVRSPIDEFKRLERSELLVQLGKGYMRGIASQLTRRIMEDLHGRIRGELPVRFIMSTLTLQSTDGGE